MVLFIVFLLSKALWAQMDIVGAFQNGTVSIKGKSLFAYRFSLFKHKLHFGCLVS